MSQSTIESDDDAITGGTIEREHPQGRTILLADYGRQIVPLDESEVVAQRQAHPRSGLFPRRRHHYDRKAARVQSLDEPNQARRLDSVVISQKQRRSIHNPATGDSYIKRSLVQSASQG
jgi:formate dehydrogenase maturation protein FdhE